MYPLRASHANDWYNTQLSNFFKESYRKELGNELANMMVSSNSARPGTRMGARPGSRAGGPRDTIDSITALPVAPGALRTDLAARSYDWSALSAPAGAGGASGSTSTFGSFETSRLTGPEVDALRTSLRKQLAERPMVGYKPRARNLSPQRTPRVFASSENASPTSTLAGSAALAAGGEPGSPVPHLRGSTPRFSAPLLAPVEITMTTYGNDFSARDPERAYYKPPIDKQYNRPRTERSEYAEILLGIRDAFPLRK